MVSMPRCGCQGNPAQVIGRILVAEVVEQQERIEFLGFAETEGALQFDAGAFDGGRGLNDFFYWTERHGFPFAAAPRAAWTSFSARRPG